MVRVGVQFGLAEHAFGYEVSDLGLGLRALSSRPKYLGFRLIICGAAIYGAWLSFLFLVVLFTSCPVVHMH